MKFAENHSRQSRGSVRYVYCGKSTVYHYTPRVKTGV